MTFGLQDVGRTGATAQRPGPPSPGQLALRRPAVGHLVGVTRSSAAFSVLLPAAHVGPDFTPLVPPGSERSLSLIVAPASRLRLMRPGFRPPAPTFRRRGYPCTLAISAAFPHWSFCSCCRAARGHHANGVAPCPRLDGQAAREGQLPSAVLTAQLASRHPQRKRLHGPAGVAQRVTTRRTIGRFAGSDRSTRAAAAGTWSAVSFTPRTPRCSGRACRSWRARRPFGNS
jgi:hypothetical protein